MRLISHKICNLKWGMRAILRWLLGMQQFDGIFRLWITKLEDGKSRFYLRIRISRILKAKNFFLDLLLFRSFLGFESFQFFGQFLAVDQCADTESVFRLSINIFEFGFVALRIFKLDHFGVSIGFRSPGWPLVSWSGSLVFQVMYGSLKNNSWNRYFWNYGKSKSVN